jgi:hypothetical protein
MSFGTFGDTGIQNLTSTTAKRNLSHLNHATDAAWPLIVKLLTVPRYKKMYLAHYATILSENVTNGSYLTAANSLQTLIGPSVQADPYKFYTYSQFQSNISTDVTVGMNTAPGISNLMSGRNTFLVAQSDFTATKPVISNVLPSIAIPVVNSTISITATVTNTNTDGVLLGYRANKFLPFTKVPLYDDGLHNDGAAEDSVYGGLLPVNSIATQYYIYAENNTIGKFSPERAEHEFYTLNATYPKIQAGQLKINEIMAQNTATITDANGEYEDWFELYNTTSTTLSLDNLYATDTATNLLKWEFPSGLIIAPYSYLTVWADEDLTQAGIHANFKFSTTGESALLSYPDGTIIETVTFGQQTPDMGYARIPNGTGNFVIQSPTFNANNQTLSSQDFEISKQHLTYSPNPTTEMVSIKNGLSPINSVSVYSVQGQLLLENTYSNQNEIVMDLSHYTKGIYFVVVNQTTTLKLIRK